MLRITTKLKRYKLIAYPLFILAFPIRLVLTCFVSIGELSESILNILNSIISNILNWVAEKYEWDKLSRKLFYSQKQNKDNNNKKR